MKAVNDVTLGTETGLTKVAPPPDFEAMYQCHPDPWDTRRSWYEMRKRQILLACLQLPFYAQVLELGCGAGTLTLPLAQRCNSMYAIDLSPTAIAHCHAALVTAGINHVQPLAMRFPDEWPEPDSGQRFDLIVVSELAYYLADDAVSPFFDACLRLLSDQGELVMCHYLPNFHDRQQETLTMHQYVSDLCKAKPLVSHLGAQFLLDIWQIPKRGMS